MSHRRINKQDFNWLLGMCFARRAKRLSRLIDSHLYEKGHLFLERKRNSNIAKTRRFSIIDMQIGLLPEGAQVITLICNERPCFFPLCDCLFLSGSFSRMGKPLHSHPGNF